MKYQTFLGAYKEMLLVGRAPPGLRLTFVPIHGFLQGEFMFDAKKLVIGSAIVSGVLLVPIVLMLLHDTQPEASLSREQKAGGQSQNAIAKYPATPSPSPAPPITIVREFSGEMTYPPGTSFHGGINSNGEATFFFDPPLPHTDGAMFGAMYDAISVVYGKDAGHYFGARLTTHVTAQGKALAIEGDEYRYLGMPAKVSDEDPRFGALTFWRESK